MLVKYIKFDLPGSFFSESHIEKYDGKVNWPKYAYAYQIGEREEIKKGEETLKGDFRWEKRHIRGKKMSREEVEREIPNNHILLGNMICNEWNYVIQCPAGNFQPLTEDDIYEDYSSKEVIE